MNKKNVITIFTYWVRDALREYGFEPFVEAPNRKHPQFMCWKYKDTPEFRQALSQISKRGRNNG